MPLEIEQHHIGPNITGGKHSGMYTVRDYQLALDENALLTRPAGSFCTLDYVSPLKDRQSSVFDLQLGDNVADDRVHLEQAI